MHTRTTVAAALLLLATLTACTGGGGDAPSVDAAADPQACKGAMVQQLKDATESDKEGKRPASCAGLDNKTLERLSGEAMTEWLDSPEADKAVEDEGLTTTPDPTTAEISDECRAWIEGELLDSSDSIDATPGYEACGYLSEEELDQAIEEVTDGLVNETTTPDQ